MLNSGSDVPFDVPWMFSTKFPDADVRAATERTGMTTNCRTERSFPSATRKRGTKLS